YDIALLGDMNGALTSGTQHDSPASGTQHDGPAGGTFDDAPAGGKLYFVEPNLRHVEDTLGVPPDELRRWIALHEATHAHEFELYPWVRPYLNDTLRQY